MNLEVREKGGRGGRDGIEKNLGESEVGSK